jgi:hypothetical protein
VEDVMLAVATFDKLDLDKDGLFIFLLPPIAHPGMLCNPEMELVRSKADLRANNPPAPQPR